MKQKGWWLWIVLVVGLASTHTVFSNVDSTNSGVNSSDDKERENESRGPNINPLDSPVCVHSSHPDHECVPVESCNITQQVTSLQCKLDGNVCCLNGNATRDARTLSVEEKKEVDTALHSGREELEKRDELEKVLKTKDLFVKPYTSEGMYNEYLNSNDKALDAERDSYVVFQAVKYLSYKLPNPTDVSDAVQRYMNGDQTSFDELFANFDMPFSAPNGQTLVNAQYGDGQTSELNSNFTSAGTSGDFVDGERESQKRHGRANVYSAGYERSCAPVKYRTVDGSCNNLKYPSYGSSFRVYNRLLPADYGDGVSAPRRAKDGSYLPSARLVSSQVVIDRSDIYRRNSLMAMQWGQFIDHEMSFTPIYKARGTHGILCCAPEIYNNPKLLHPECYPIAIPENDYFYKNHRNAYQSRCMEFVRSLAGPTSYGDRYGGKRQQLNQVSSFIDGSLLYGSSYDEEKVLRSYYKGQLKSTKRSGREFIPLEIDRACTDPSTCFRVIAGDSRANQHPWLTVLHNLFLRAHNYYAYELANINPNWDDEYVYQETRRLIAAQLQHITYNEFLPSLFGYEFLSQYGLTLKQYGYTYDYNENVNSASLNEFAGAAFRVGHSLIYDNIEYRSRDYGDGKLGKLRDHYFSAYEILEDGVADKYLLSLMSQWPERADVSVTKEVTNYLFKTKNASYGMDLVSLNIQRGRDHGLPSYNEYRKLCGLKKVYSFDELYPSIDREVITKLKYLYKSVDDIDLYIGGIAEKHNRYAILGPTFSCIIANQFRRVKRGDRFWYELGGQPSSFTPEQLQEIRKTTLGRTICSFADRITYAQGSVFRSPENNNPIVSCKDTSAHPRIDLTKWRQSSNTGYSGSVAAPVYDKTVLYDGPASGYNPSYGGPPEYGGEGNLYMSTGTYSGPASQYEGVYGSDYGEAPIPPYKGPVPVPDSIGGDVAAYDNSGYSKSAPTYDSSGYSAPAPAYGSSGYSGPAPAYDTSGYSGPAPAYDSSGYSGPAPAYDTSGYSGPVPAYNTGYSGPAPAYDSSGYSGPAPAYDSSGYSEPAPAYNTGYSGPAPAYDSSGYSGPAPAYDSSGYSEPAPAYDSGGYSGPAPAYDTSGYSGPAPAYNTGYSGPAPAYDSSGSVPAYDNSGYSEAAPTYGSSGYSGPAPAYGSSGYSGPAPAYGGSGYSGPAPAYDSSGYSGPAPAYDNSGYSEAAPTYDSGGYSGPAPAYGSSGYSGPAPAYDSSGYSGPAPAYGSSGYSGPAPAYGSSGSSGPAPAYGSSGYSGPAPAYGGSGYSGSVPAYGGSGYSGSVPASSYSSSSSYDSRAPYSGGASYDSKGYSSGQSYGGPVRRGVAFEAADASGGDENKPSYEGGDGASGLKEYDESSHNNSSHNGGGGDDGKSGPVERAYPEYGYAPDYGIARNAYASASKSAYDSANKASSDYDKAKSDAYSSEARGYDKEAATYGANRDSYRDKDYYKKYSEADYYGRGAKYGDRKYGAKRKYHETKYGATKAYEDTVYSSDRYAKQQAKGDHKEYGAAASRDKSAYDSSSYGAKSKADSYSKAAESTDSQAESDKAYNADSKSSYDSDASYSSSTDYAKPVYKASTYDSSYSKPSYSSNPTYSSYDKSYSSGDSSYGDSRPSYSGSSYGEYTPGYSGSSYGESRPSYSGSSYTEYSPEYSGPSYGESSSSYSGSSYRDSRPSYSGSSYTEYSPEYSGPSYGESSSSYSGSSYGEYPPGYSGSSYGESRPSYSGSSYTEYSPGYSGSSYGESSSSYGGSSYGGRSPQYSGSTYGTYTPGNSDSTYSTSYSSGDSSYGGSRPGYSGSSYDKGYSAGDSSYTGSYPGSSGATYGEKKPQYSGSDYKLESGQTYSRPVADGSGSQNYGDRYTRSQKKPLHDSKGNETDIELGSSDDDIPTDANDSGILETDGDTGVNKTTIIEKSIMEHGNNDSEDTASNERKERASPYEYGYSEPSYASSAYASKASYDSASKANVDHDAAKSSAYGAEASYYDKEAAKYGAAKDTYYDSDYAKKHSEADYYGRGAAYGDKRYGSRKKFYETSYGAKKAYEDSVYSADKYGARQAKGDRKEYDAAADHKADAYDASSYSSSSKADDYDTKKDSSYYSREHDDAYKDSQKDSYAKTSAAEEESVPTYTAPAPTYSPPKPSYNVRYDSGSSYGNTGYAGGYTGGYDSGYGKDSSYPRGYGYGGGGGGSSYPPAGYASGSSYRDSSYGRNPSYGSGSYRGGGSNYGYGSSTEYGNPGYGGDSSYRGSTRYSRSGHDQRYPRSHNGDKHAETETVSTVNSTDEFHEDDGNDPQHEMNSSKKAEGFEDGTDINLEVAESVTHNGTSSNNDSSPASREHQDMSNRQERAYGRYGGSYEPSYASAAYASKASYDSASKANADHDAAKSSEYGAEASYYDKEASKYGAAKDTYYDSDYAKKHSEADNYGRGAAYGDKRYGARKKFYESSYGAKKAYEDSLYSADKYGARQAKGDHKEYDAAADHKADVYDASSYSSRNKADDYDTRKDSSYYSREHDDKYKDSRKDSYVKTSAAKEEAVPTYTAPAPTYSPPKPSYNPVYYRDSNYGYSGRPSYGGGGDNNYGGRTNYNYGTRPAYAAGSSYGNRYDQRYTRSHGQTGDPFTDSDMDIDSNLEKILEEVQRNAQNSTVNKTTNERRTSKQTDSHRPARPAEFKEIHNDTISDEDELVNGNTTDASEETDIRKERSHAEFEQSSNPNVHVSKVSYDSRDENGHDTQSEYYNKEAAKYDAAKDSYKTVDSDKKYSKGDNKGNKYGARRKYYESAFGARKAFEDSIYDDGEDDKQKATGSHEDHDATTDNIKSSNDESVHESTTTVDDDDKRMEHNDTDKADENDSSATAADTYEEQRPATV